VPLHWHKNPYLRYGVGHKQPMLKAMTRLIYPQSNLSNIISQIQGKYPKTEAAVGRKTPTGDNAWGTPPSEDPLKPTNTRKPPRATSHGKRDGEWPSCVVQGVKTPWRVMTTCQSLMSVPPDASGGWTRG